MEAGDVVWLLVVLFWLFSGVIRWIGKNLKGKKPAEQPAAPPPAPAGRPASPPAARPGVPRPPAAPPRAPSPQDALADLLKRIGVDVDPYAAEQPVPGEHTPTASERRRTPSEHGHTPGWHQRTASEHEHTSGWHDRTASEVRPTASEHELTASEHRRGDVRRAAVVAPPPRRPAAAGLGRRLIADLRSSESLARAIVLREILGPPVGLRQAGDRAFER